VIVENHIQPHQGFGAHSHRDVEIVTYVSAGCLTHKDSFGHTAGVTAGEMQLISAGSNGMVHSEQNVHEEVEHNLQIWLVPSKRPTPFAYHQLKYKPEERQGRFRLYVSPDGRDGSMPIHTGASIYAGLFAKGDTARHRMEMSGAWVQVVGGQVKVAGVTLGKGDGWGLWARTSWPSLLTMRRKSFCSISIWMPRSSGDSETKYSLLVSLEQEGTFS
jgi:redox-sensitive bicupin YhaK (pirin superfamily)